MGRISGRAEALPLAMLAAALALFAIALVQAPRALAVNAYGQLCAEFESDTDPYAYDASDPYGGNVFGAFQMSSGHAIAYARQLQADADKTRAAYGQMLVDAYAKDGGACTKNFAKAWASVFKGDADSFLQTQYTYVKANYYTPAASAWASAVPGFKASAYSTALQNVIFSTAVQHGVSGSASIFALAMEGVGGFKAGMAEDRIIAAVYAERAKVEKYSVLKKRVLAKNSAAAVYKIATGDGGLLASAYGLKGMTLTHFYSNPGAVQVGVYNRLASREPARAFALYKAYAGKDSAFTASSVQTMSKASAVAACKHAKTTGGQVTGYSALTDRDHEEHVAEVVCADCGQVLKAAATRTVANKFVQKGTTWKDASGRSYTVHSKGWYKSVYEMNVRSKASTKGTVKTTLSKGKPVKVTKAVMGSDGFWWGEVKAGGASGYVQLQYLSKIGTASGVHKYGASGACAYCGKTKPQVARMKSIAAAVKKGARKCTFAKAGKSYANAYANSKAVKKSYKKGAKVKVVKVVKNRKNDYWALTSSGTYVELSLLK